MMTRFGDMVSPKGDTPVVKMRRTAHSAGRSARSGTPRSTLTSMPRHSTAVTPWPMMVARAAPYMPQPKTPIMVASSTMLVTKPAIIAAMAKSERPRLRNTGARPVENTWKKVPRMMTWMYSWPRS